jgi:hypothetical protein
MRAMVVVLMFCVATACSEPTAPTSPDTAPPPASVTAVILCDGRQTACAVEYDSAATISWSASNAASCQIAGTDWSGTSGSHSTGRLTEGRDYQVRCTGAASETTTASVRVNVGSRPAPSQFAVSGICSAAGPATQHATLRWSAAPQASTYIVERRAGSTAAWAKVAETTGLEHVEPVPDDTDFYFRVTASNVSGLRIGDPSELLVCRQIVRPPTIPAGPGAPRIELTFVPAIGSFADLRGLALHVLPADHKVACFINVLGTYWPKPTFAQQRVPISAVDGSWTCDITTGGIDEQATEVRAYLVTNRYQPNGALPTGPEVLAVVGAKR